MKLLAVNGSPRRFHNTGSLLEKIVAGAMSQGAEAELVHLYSLQYKGCTSCFQCKLVGGPSYGRCAVKDGLTPLLDKAHEADVLVLGSPFYFSTETGMMRAFMERLWFQYYLYSNKKAPLSPHKKATALVYTMNISAERLSSYPKEGVMTIAKGVMEKLFAPCELFLCTDTRQMDDYSKYEVDMFDTDAKEQRHREVFPKDLERAFALGQKLVGG